MLNRSANWRRSIVGRIWFLLHFHNLCSAKNWGWSAIGRVADGRALFPLDCVANWRWRQSAVGRVTNGRTPFLQNLGSVLLPVLLRQLDGRRRPFIQDCNRPVLHHTQLVQHQRSQGLLSLNLSRMVMNSFNFNVDPFSRDNIPGILLSNMWPWFKNILAGRPLGFEKYQPHKKLQNIGQNINHVV